MDELTYTPELIQDAGDASRYAWDEFVASTSLSSRPVYLRLAKRFFAHFLLGSLVQITYPKYPLLLCRLQ